MCVWKCCMWKRLVAETPLRCLLEEVDMWGYLLICDRVVSPAPNAPHGTALHHPTPRHQPCMHATYIHTPIFMQALHCIALHDTQLHNITWHYITLHNIINYITLHNITLHCIALHYITLHYIIYHYIALHRNCILYTYKNNKSSFVISISIRILTSSLKETHRVCNLWFKHNFQVSLSGGYGI